MRALHWQGPPKPQATFIGKAGLRVHVRPNRFRVDWGILTNTIGGLKEIQLYVQGVTNRGRMMEWEPCVFVDASR